MILKASQRGGPRQLAAHLLNERDNDHIAVQEVRGFVADDLHGAMTETVAIARGTNCRQPVFSLSLSPPKEAQASAADFMAAADRAEALLGLTGQPRALVIHEKEGRRHAHVVWSRIDAQSMKAVNLPFFKTRLKGLSKELYLEHGWTLPEGHRENGWKNPLNFTLAEWQQAKRLDLDPREIKQVFQDAWAHSDSLAGFRNALEERGYYLAKGDRRGFVATGLSGDVLSVARWTGVRTKEMSQRLGTGDDLPPLAEVQTNLRKAVTRKLREHLTADRQDKQAQLQPLKDELRTLVMNQRVERARLAARQQQRWSAETRERAGRFRSGVGVVLDVVSLRMFRLRKQNEQEAYAAFVRDRTQRQQLYDAQIKDREPLQAQVAAIQLRHREERQSLAIRISSVLRLQRDGHAPTRQLARDHQPKLER